MTGQPPFKGETITALYSKIKTVNYERPAYFSVPLINLLNKILVKNPAERIDMEAIRLDEWVNIEEIEPPARIPPRIVGNIEPGSLAKNIQGMSVQDGMAVYNFIPLNKKVTESRSRRSSIAPSTNSFQSSHFPISPISPSTASIPGEVSLGPSARRGSRVLTQSDFRSKRRGSDFPLSPTSPSKADFSNSGKSQTVTYSDYDNIKSSDFLGKDRKASVNQLSPSPTKLFAPKVQPRGRSQSIQVTSFATNLKIQNKASETSISPHTSKAPFTSRDLARQKYSTPIEADLISIADSDSNVVTEELPIVSEAEIYEWHTIHKPPKEIRTIRWSFSAKLTSHLPPPIMFQHVHRALDELNVQYYGNLTYKRIPDYYIFDCGYAIPNSDEYVVFEIEVSKVWLLKVHGVKVKRSKGDSFIFKELLTAFSALLHFEKS